MKLRIATTQFPVSADLDRNAAYIVQYVATAQRARAQVVLFPEGALSGYVGIDCVSSAGYDWEHLQEATERVTAAARRHGVWVVCGTLHRSRPALAKPLNSVVVIDPGGLVVARYDKRLLAVSEQANFRAGERPVVVRIAGVRCGLLICHEWRYPELYRQYRDLGAGVILQSWYDGGYDQVGWRREGQALAGVIPATVQGHAVCNHLWICGSNTSRKHSSFGGFLLRPDGRFQARQPRHRPGVLVETLDTSAPIPYPSAHNCARAARCASGT
jgi:deaminated glutathione amidase